MATKTARNVYDPRIRELIRATGNPDLFPELDIPRFTISGWLRGDFKPAVGAQALSQSEVELHARVAKLATRVQILLAVVRLLLALVRVSGCRLTGERLAPDCESAFRRPRHDPAPGSAARSPTGMPGRSGSPSTGRTGCWSH